jgi:hypothetical protein
MWAILRTALLAAGWTQQGSGDGSTFSNAAAGPVTNGGVGATGLDGNGRWVRFRDPSGNREIVISQGAGGATYWSLHYSYSARFTGGSPGASQRPTASDELAVFVNTAFHSTASGYAHAIVENVAINGVWGWWLVRTVQGSSTRADFIACDPVSSTANESRYAVLAGAIDPCVWLSFPNEPDPSFSPGSLGTQIKQLWHPGTVSAAFYGLLVAKLGDITGGGAQLVSGSGGHDGIPADTWATGDDLVACYWFRFVSMSDSTPGIIVGASHHLSTKCVIVRQYPDSVEHASQDLAWLYYGRFGIPWPKGTTPSA